MTRLPIHSPIFASVFTLALFCASALHAEEARTINDCEKIQGADAYNQCLAKFGPTSKLRSLEPERPGDVKSSAAEAAATAKPLVGHPSKESHRRVGGRHRARFTVTRRRHR